VERVFQGLTEESIPLTEESFPVTEESFPGGNLHAQVSRLARPDDQAGFSVANAHGVPDAICHSIAQAGDIRAFDQRQ
jgi:hypothetical protein